MAFDWVRILIQMRMFLNIFLFTAANLLFGVFDDALQDLAREEMPM